MDKVVLFVSTSSRFDEPLLTPVKKRLKQVPGIEVKSLIIPANDVIGAYKFADVFARGNRIDLAFTPFDRIEMLGAAIALFQHNIKLCQMGAGDLSLEGAWDDEVRHCITLMATLIFCNGQKSYDRAKHLKGLTQPLNELGMSSEPHIAGAWPDRSFGKYWSVFEVGSTALDDIAPDYREVGTQNSFDLVLYSPPTKQTDRIITELREIEAMLNKRVAWIGPTSDPGWTTIVDYITDLQKRNPNVHFYVSTDRPKFLALVDRCDRFLGNSSSLFVEAPFFKPREKLIHIGVRNKGREFIVVRTGGSDRIAEHVRKFLEV